ncbi:MAG: radical SAM protein [Clostridia bacterium]|nr:radical SAM protein [Clostridia bacterium]
MVYRKVYVEITNICNMNCSFCHGTKRAPRRMSLEEFRVILEKLQLHTHYIYYHLMGEPLTHPELETFIKTATEKGFKSVITTNGTLLKQKGQVLIDQKAHKVSVSLHSFEGDDTVAHRKYLKEVAEFAKTANSQGIIVVLRLWNNGCDNGKNAEAIDFLKGEIEGEWVENTKGLRIRDKLFLEYGDRFQWPDKDADVQGDDVFCYGLRDHFGILSDGTVVPCCLDSDGVINLGNVFEKNLEEILSSEQAKAIVKGFDGRKASEELCRRCAYAQRFK